MPDLLLTASVEYGGYISIIKFVIFVIAFLAALPVITWIHRDSEEVGTDQVLWTSIILAAVGVTLLLWLVVPVFIVGLIIYLIAVGAAALSYIKTRDSNVDAEDRIFNIEHLKGLLSREKQDSDSSQGFAFITANNNECPMPESKTPSFFGYKAALELFKDASWRRADNIILIPTQQSYNLTYYIDGAAIKQPDMEKEKAENFIHFVKNLSDMDASEKRKPQKGEFSIRRGRSDTDWKVASAGSTAGEQMRLKRTTMQSTATLDSIGLGASQHQALDNLASSEKGLFIVTGPPKSGLTSTFYALLRNHDAFINSIVALEREPSEDLGNITQEVFTLSDTGTTNYAQKLKNLLRMGPEVLGVAGCQDTETARIVCETAKERIVYLTLPAEGVTQALSKWIKLVGDRDIAIESLMGISSQRLLRRLCDECKQGYEPNREILRKFNIPVDKAKAFYRVGKVQYNKHGKEHTCENCQGTGFLDRIGIFEIIIIDASLKDAIRRSKSFTEIGSHFRAAKMLYLQEQALKRVVDGTTAINEMVRVLSVSKPKKPEQKK